MIKWISLGLVMALGMWCDVAFSPLHAQGIERERESTVTGPRGRSITRSLEVQRGPGTYQRELQIQRPGGTLDRSMSIQRGWRGGFPGGGLGFRGAPILERNIFVGPRPASSFSFGLMAAPIIPLPFFGGGFGGGFGGFSGGPPPPVVVAPPGAVAPGMPQGSPGQASALDPVALTAQRLQSHHANSRKDAALELGRLGDPRAVPPLVYALKYDSSKEVKVAAASALGQLGGSEAEVVLERCIIYEKKQDVRDAAATALRRLRERRASAPQRSLTAAPTAPQTNPSLSDQPGQIESTVPRLSPAPPPASQSSPFRSSSPAAAAEPSLDGPQPGDAGSSDAQRVPPPPPTPVNPR